MKSPAFGEFCTGLPCFSHVLRKSISVTAGRPTLERDRCSAQTSPNLKRLLFALFGIHWKSFSTLSLIFACLPALGQALNPAVTQANIHRTICVPGWTKTVRPPVAYTNGVKHNLMQRRHIAWARAGEFELDHIVPLELGGAPRDPANLQLQPWNGRGGAHAKDAVETRMKRLVCVGRVTLEAARRCMARDWRACAR